jgi:adenine-specific DNA methylase
VIGLALIENNQQTLSEAEIELILSVQDPSNYPDFIQKNFQDIYYTDAENSWLDSVIYNINHLLKNPYKQALAQFALFQACIIKRPYNLFHRANLYMRTAEIKRSFGNKKTWDTPFETHFRNFIAEANQAVFDNGQDNTAIQCDALETPIGADLVYIDPPYINQKGTRVEYRDFYHYLEGVVNDDTWAVNIDYDSKHRRLVPQKSPWIDAKRITDEFEQLIKHHQNSILVISYRDDGIPSKEQLIELLHQYKNDVQESAQPMKYALARKKSQELLLIAI